MVVAIGCASTRFRRDPRLVEPGGGQVYVIRFEPDP
jgi:hypothetical protein